MRCVLAWLLFWCGHYTDRWLVPYGLNWRAELFGNLYQWFMRKSVAIQGDGRGPWREP